MSEDVQGYIVRPSKSSIDEEATTPKQLVHSGISNIEEAILSVLFEAKQNGNNPFVRLVDMRRKLGTHSEWKNDNWLIRSLLYKLEFEDKRVWQNGKGGPWQLTDAEYNQRKVEIEDEKP